MLYKQYEITKWVKLILIIDNCGYGSKDILSLIVWCKIRFNCSS